MLDKQQSLLKDLVYPVPFGFAKRHIMAGKSTTIEWGAESLRATYFAIPTQKKVDDLFASVVGAKPEAYQGWRRWRDAG